MDIDKMIFVKMIDDINYTGEVLENNFFKNGLILKISKESEIKVWLPLERIESIYFPDKSMLINDENLPEKLFVRLNEISREKDI